VAWEVEVTDEWADWYDGLAEPFQDELAAVIGLLEIHGPQLGFPYTSGVTSSKHAHMREMRVQAGGRPIRVLYAFDPRRIAILLLGGDKTGDNRWYARAIPEADRLYDEHLKVLRKEKLIQWPRSFELYSNRCRLSGEKRSRRVHPSYSRSYPSLSFERPAIYPRKNLLPLLA
jgi:hypothetical protein